MSNGVAMVKAMMQASQKGNPKAFVAVANLLGEMTQKVEVAKLPTIVDDVPRAPDPVRPAPAEGGDA